MQRLSVFDMLKIGVGPSSSHTMGPWRAAQRFVATLSRTDFDATERIQVDLFGSLAKTGKGHGTDFAVQLGLSGEDPESIDVDEIHRKVGAIGASRRLQLGGSHEIAFHPRTDILFHVDQQLAFHPNGMRLTAFLRAGRELSEVYFSLGGGFIVSESECNAGPEEEEVLPYPIDTALQMLAHCDAAGQSISEIVMQNELVWRDAHEVTAGLTNIRTTMFESIHRGCSSDGLLPGGLDVRRRAAGIARSLLGVPTPSDIESWMTRVRHSSHSFQQVLDWVSCCALAVNEENAAFGRIVTAPTNGAAGVVPAVLFYCTSFCDTPDDVHIQFLLTAAEIGCLFKKGATISAAMGGCQAEIGVSSAMAAAALTESLGGTPAQAAEAAEIAMEHHLGMTCDPIGGLVQIPCIERNAMGAIKAITAAQLALQRAPGEARVSLDAVIKTMWETAQDMSAKYKETSEGGLAIQIPVNVPEC